MARSDRMQAAKAAYVAWQRARGVPEAAATWELMGDSKERWLAVAEAVRAAIYAELGNEHYVIFTEDRWTVEHSVECKLSGHMHECAYHDAVRLIADEYDPDRAGRWRITGIDSEGLPSLERTPDGP